MFEETLSGLIRGIRANKKNEQRYIAERLQEIRKEVKSNDPDVKATAVSKLTYLQMLGYDMSWASFHVVEVMSSAKFNHKRSGYLAATQSFSQETDVLMLTTNLLKKDLASSNHLEVGVALNGLSLIVTPDLARDLCQDLVAMLNHSRPYVRKKVVLALYKVFLKYPEGLRLSFPKLKERLEDPDPSVVSAVVNVICELARKNPKNYLSLAPQLFKLLTNSSNNWMLIKIIKLFGALTPLEPRLAKKLLSPITNLIQTTQAMSLLYECVHTVITGGMLSMATNSDSLAAMCVNKLKTFLEDPDQNLKYIGLLALGKIVPTHPKLVAEHRDIILQCIDDADISIRLPALDLVVGMVNKKNLPDIVKRLMAHLLPSPADDSPPSLLEPAYRADIINRIVFVCSQNSYNNIANFEWYVAVLVDLTFIAGTKVGDLLSNQIMDVGVRVKSVRQYCVKAMQRILFDATILENCTLPDSNCEVLYAAAWIAGEYCSYLDNPLQIIECLLRPGVTKLPHNVQAVYVHNVLKIYSFWANSLLYNWDRDSKEDLIRATTLVKDNIPMFCSCTDLEVQERAYNVREIFTVIYKDITTLDTNGAPQDDKIFASTLKPPKIVTELPPLFFSYELNPVAPKAQKKVPLPDGLDLDTWIHEPIPDPQCSDNERGEEPEESYGHGYGQKIGGSGDLVFSSGNGTTFGRRRKSLRRQKYGSDESDEVNEVRRKERRERIKNDPYYIGGDSGSSKKPKVSRYSHHSPEEIDVDSIKIVHLTMDDFDTKSRKHKSTNKSRKSKKTNPGESTPPSPSTGPVIYTDVGEMPENATLSDDEKDTIPSQSSSVWIKKQDKGILDVDFSGISNVDLSTPLAEDEIFPQPTVYLSPEEVRRREEERVNRLKMEERRLMHARATERVSKEKREGSKKNKSIKKKQDVGEISLTDENTGKAKKVSKNKEEGGIKVSKKKMEKTAKEVKKKGKKIPTLVLKSHKKKASTNNAEMLKIPSKLLAHSDGIEITYTLRLASSIEPKSEPPLLIAVFNMRRTEATGELDPSISQIVYKFDPSSDIQFESTLIRLEGDLIRGEDKEAIVEFRVLGIVGTGLNVSGRLNYEKQSLADEQDLQKTTAEIPFTFPIPISVFMLKVPSISPKQFKSLVSKSADFPFSSATTGTLNIHSTSSPESVEQLFQSTIHQLSLFYTGTHIVEQVSGAATIYGKTVQGYQVAGMVKLNMREQIVKDSDQYTSHKVQSFSETIDQPLTRSIASISVEFKCTDQAFLDGLVTEVEEFFQTL
ncbi:hypothetical protein G9A89_022781 [Geosiphon pyriformis]|nr:hypothetical protein G9A89_022781 [Geosiphon pyriformis]